MKRIYVNQYVVDRNGNLDLSAKGAPEQLEPPIIVEDGVSSSKGLEVVINGTTKVVYRPDNPLPCGSKVWIETTEEVEVLVRGNDEVL